MTLKLPDNNPSTLNNLMCSRIGNTCWKHELKAKVGRHRTMSEERWHKLHVMCACHYKSCSCRIHAHPFGLYMPLLYAIISLYVIIKSTMPPLHFRHIGVTGRLLDGLLISARICNNQQARLQVLWGDLICQSAWHLTVTWLVESCGTRSHRIHYTKQSNCVKKHATLMNMTALPRWVCMLLGMVLSKITKITTLYVVSFSQKRVDCHKDTLGQVYNSVLLHHVEPLFRPVGSTGKLDTWQTWRLQMPAWDNDSMTRWPLSHKYIHVIY